MPEQAKDIFLAAIQQPVSERDAWLDGACAHDAELRRRVNQLLGAHAAEDSFLQQPAVQTAEFVSDDRPERQVLGTLGDFRIVREVGRGGMGVVYEAEQISLKRRVALKVLPFAAVLDNRQLQRFRTEAMAAARLHHQHIVPVYQVGCDRATHFYAMQYIDGRNVAELIGETRRTAGIAPAVGPGPASSPTESPAPAPAEKVETAKLADITTGYTGNRLAYHRKVAELGVQAANALDFAHQHGILHRDIKPSNLMLDSEGALWITDFGLARIEGDDGLTMSGDLLGTLRYMSPEQALGKRVVIDQRTDVYSLGVSLYEMLTLRPAYGGEDRAELLRQISFESPTPLRKIDPTIPADLETIVLMAMAREPHRRYETAQELADDLQRFLDSKPILARRPSRVERVQKWVLRNKPLTASLALVLMAAALAGYGTYLVGQRPVSQSSGQENTASAQTRETNDDLPAPEPPSSTAPALTQPEQAADGDAIIANTAVPQISGIEVPDSLARPAEIIGLVPDPPLIPDVGRWQMITRQPRSIMRSAVWSPDEQQIAFAEANNVRIHDALDTRLLHVMVAHSRPVTSVAWHPGGKRLASSSEDGTVRLWSSTGKPTHLLEGHTGPVYQVAWRPDGTQLASASADGTVRIWSADGRLMRTLDDGKRHVFAIDWEPAGNLLASVGGDIRPKDPNGDLEDNSVRIWNADTGKPERQMKPLVSYPGLCVDWRPDGEQLAVGFGHVYRSTNWIGNALPNAGVRVWNRNGTGPLAVGRDVGSVRVVAWHPEGTQLAFGGRDGDVYLSSTKEGTAARTLEDSAVDLFSGGSDGDVMLRISEGETAARVLVDHAIDLYSICWNRHGTKLLSCCRKSLRETNLFGDSLTIVESSELRGGLLKTVKWSPDGQLVAANGEYFWTADGERVAEPPSRNSMPVWWNRDWHAQRPDGSSPPRIDFTSSPPSVDFNWKFAWSKDGWLAGGNWYDHKVRIWDAQGRIKATLPGHRGGVESVAWSPDGTQVASAGGDSVRLWQRDGTFLTAITGHSDEVYPVEWSPDGQWIATGSSDSTVRLWRPDGSPGPVPVLYGHQAGVFALAWSPDSRKLASASWLDNTVRVWDVQTGKTDWFALVIDLAAMAPFSPTGQLRVNPSAIDTTGLMYVVERQTGEMELLTFKEFRDRCGDKLARVFSNRFQNASVTANLDRAERAFVDSRALVGDGDPEDRGNVADNGAKLARARLARSEFDLARQSMADVIEIRQQLRSDASESGGPTQALASAYSLLGWILGAAGREAEARAAFSEQIRWIESLDFADPPLNCAQDELARAHFSRALHADTQEEALADTATMLQLVQQDFWLAFEVIRRLDAVVRLGSNSAEPATDGASPQEPRIRIALDVFDEVLRQRPDLARAHFVGDWLVTAPASLRNADLPLQWAQRAVERRPNDTLALQSLLWARFRRGEAEAALDVLDGSSPSNNESAFVLAQLHASLGHDDDARRFLQAGNAWFNGPTGFARQSTDYFWRDGILIHPTADMEARLQAEAAERIAELGPVADVRPADGEPTAAADRPPDP